MSERRNPEPDSSEPDVEPSEPDADPPDLDARSHLGRVALRVADLDEVTDFYTEVVGLSVLDRTPAEVQLGAGENPLLVLIDAPDAPERGRDEAGLFHVAFRVPTREALGGALRRVDAAPSARLSGASDHLVSEALYLRDPEGNGVEIYRDRPREEWPTEDGRVRMDSLPLDLDALREEAAVSPADRLPAGSDVGHVHLEVTDLDATETFYVDVVGLRVRQRFGPSALFLAAGDYHHHVGANAWNDRRRPQPPDARGIAWYELVVPDHGVLKQVRERLPAANHATEPGHDPETLEGDREGVTVRDPNGVAVRLVVE